ncbi:MAG: PilZ domain-containing protein [Mariprofundaceae bacterium]
MSDEELGHGRQDFRIDDVIPMSDAPLSTEEYELKKTQVGIRSRQSSMLQEMVGRDVFSSDSPSGVSHDVANAMEALDAKLNYLIGVNMLNDANRSDLKDRPVNLSVTGLSFVSDERYRQGDPIELSIMLPSFPPTVLDLIGEVVRARTLDNGRSDVAVHVIYRCDEEEDAIAKYVFKRHRELIRLKNRNND